MKIANRGNGTARVVLPIGHVQKTLSPSSSCARAPRSTFNSKALPSSLRRLERTAGSASGAPQQQSNTSEATMTSNCSTPHSTESEKQQHSLIFRSWNILIFTRSELQQRAKPHMQKQNSPNEAPKRSAEPLSLRSLELCMGLLTPVELSSKSGCVRQSLSPMPDPPYLAPQGHLAPGRGQQDRVSSMSSWSVAGLHPMGWAAMERLTGPPV